jgi:FtsZ-binding cell division protein ZapB
MQETSSAIPHWLQLALSTVAGVVSAIGIDRLYNNWLNRKKPVAEIHVTEATATEITVKSAATAGDAMMKFMDRLNVAQDTIDRVRAEAQQTIDRLRAERDSWQDEHDKIFVERDQVVRENSMLKSEVKLYAEEIKRMSATLTLEDENYDGTKHIKVAPLDPDKGNA